MPSSSPTNAPDIRPAGTPAPQPSSAVVVEVCADSGEDCRSTRCCNDASMKCYEKSEYWAGCKTSCEPGIDPHDPEEYQSPWTCNLVSSSPAPTEFPKPVPTVVPTAAPTELLTLSPSKEPTMSPAMPTPQPSTPPVAVQTSSPDTSNCGNTWAQCGGKDFKGGTCCKGSNICKFSNP